MMEMGAPRFFRLAVRLAAYEGVIRRLVQNDMEQERERLEEAGIESKPIPLTPEMLRAGLGGDLFD